MDTSALNESEKALFNWFVQQPRKAIAAKEIREKANEIWNKQVEDGPRVARKLWEYGLLERAGGKAPYWFEPSVNHDEVMAARRIMLFRRTLKSVRLQLQALSEYAATPGIVSPDIARKLAQVCSETQIALKNIG